MPRKGYSSITVPSNIARRARRLLDSPDGERYHSLTELASAAIEEKLEALKGVPIVSTGTVSWKDAKRMILEYLERNPGAHYPSDIAYTLGLELEVVFEVTESLLHEHLVETKHESPTVVEAR